MPSCFQLPGSLSVTQQSLNAVGDSLDVTVEMLVGEANRYASTDAGTYTYYIQTTGDLNALITYRAADPSYNLDDAYSFAGFSKSNDASANIFLPEVSLISVAAGLIDASNSTLNASAAPGGTFPVTLTLAVSSIGLMTGSITISGSNVTCGVVDTNLKAQVAYWDLSGVSVPTVVANTADILDATVSASMLTYNFSSQLATILAYYNHMQMIDSWTVSLAAVASATDNTLSRYARNIGNTGNSNVFASGAKVMAITPFSYHVEILDHLGQAITIVPAADVYGLVAQL
jgi:hypothetical protein